jgi:hypothetical protein
MKEWYWYHRVNDDAPLVMAAKARVRYPDLLITQFYRSPERISPLLANSVPRGGDVFVRQGEIWTVTQRSRFSPLHLEWGGGGLVSQRGITLHDLRPESVKVKCWQVGLILGEMATIEGENFIPHALHWASWLEQQEEPTGREFAGLVDFSLWAVKRKLSQWQSVRPRYNACPPLHSHIKHGLESALRGMRDFDYAPRQMVGATR